MSACTFFGNSNTKKEVLPILRNEIINLIEKENVNLFYVGNHGNFDSMVVNILKELKVIYPNINYYIVLAYIPQKDDYRDFSDTIYPEGLELTPLKYAISKRNYWMINKSEFVVTHVKYTFGGADNFKNVAIKKGKTVIELSK